MRKQLIRWMLPLVAILVIATVMVLNLSLGMAHAAPATTSQHTRVVSPVKSGFNGPASVWHG